MLEPGTFNIFRQQLHHVNDKHLNNKTVTMKTTNHNYKKWLKFTSVHTRMMCVRKCWLLAKTPTFGPIKKHERYKNGRCSMWLW